MKRDEKKLRKILNLTCCLTCFILILLMMAGCGNMSVGIGNYEFGGIHIDTYNVVGCHEIETWYDNENGLEVKIKGGNSIFISEGTTYILYEDKCPICTKGEN